MTQSCEVGARLRGVACFELAPWADSDDDVAASHHGAVADGFTVDGDDPVG